MSKWLRSGLRRDVCVVVADADAPTAQECKAALESQYDDRIEPKTFYGALEALVDAGHLASTSDGIHDRYELTAGGRRALDEQFAWMRASLSE